MLYVMYVVCCMLCMLYVVCYVCCMLCMLYVVCYVWYICICYLAHHEASGGGKRVRHLAFYSLHRTAVREVGCRLLLVGGQESHQRGIERNTLLRFGYFVLIIVLIIVLVLLIVVLSMDSMSARLGGMLRSMLHPFSFRVVRVGFDLSMDMDASKYQRQD
jgi:Ca2+/Na+ antiporter